MPSIRSMFTTRLPCTEFHHQQKEITKQAMRLTKDGPGMVPQFLNLEYMKTVEMISFASPRSNLRWRMRCRDEKGLREERNKTLSTAKINKCETNDLGNQLAQLASLIELNVNHCQIFKPP